MKGVCLCLLILGLWSCAENPIDPPSPSTSQSVITYHLDEVSENCQDIFQSRVRILREDDILILSKVYQETELAIGTITEDDLFNIEGSFNGEQIFVCSGIFLNKVVLLGDCISETLTCEMGYTIDLRDFLPPIGFY